MTAEEYIEIDNNLVSAELPTDEELVEEIILAKVDIEYSSEGEGASISVKVRREALVDSQEVFRTERIYDRK